MSVVCPKGCGSSWSSRCGAFLKRSEEHTSELQSQSNLVCRLLLEKKKNYKEPNRPSRDYKFAGLPRDKRTRTDSVRRRVLPHAAATPRRPRHPGRDARVQSTSRDD